VLHRTGMAGIAAGLAAAALAAACGGTPASPSSPAAAAPVTSPSSPTTGLPSLYSQFYGAQVSLDGASVVLRATSVPDHPSPYFGPGHAQYEPPHAGMVVNPNRILPQDLVLRVPVAPSVTSPSDTPLGPIGVAVNGVALFNQYAAARAPVDAEIPTFDRFNGHPTEIGTYHHHLEPLWLTAQSSSRLIGVLLDGFPVYGTRDADGALPTGLDACNGHVGPTPDFPQGTYHYHITSGPPYIAGCFRGQPGTLG